MVDGGINTSKRKETMKIQQIMEGVIQIPDDILKAANEFALNYTLSCVLQDSEDDMEIGVIISKLFPSFSEVSTDWMRAKPFKVTKKNIPPNYAAKLKAPFTITVVIGRTGVTEGGRAEYDTETSSVLVDVEGLEFYENAVSDPANYLRRLMGEVVTSVRHEMMHAIQQNVFGIDVSDEASKYMKGNDLDQDAYHNSDMEFGPLLVTYAGDFVASLPEFVRKNPSKIRERLDRYIRTLPFFADVKKKNPEKWKKAIKYFYGLVRQQLN